MQAKAPVYWLNGLIFSLVNSGFVSDSRPMKMTITGLMKIKPQLLPLSFSQLAEERNETGIH
jgi:hypothetical protein